MLLFALEVITLLFLFVCLCLGLLSTQGNEFYLSLESLVNGLSIFALDYQLILSSFFFFFFPSIWKRICLGKRKRNKLCMACKKAVQMLHISVQMQLISFCMSILCKMGVSFLIFNMPENILLVHM